MILSPAVKLEKGSSGYFGQAHSPATTRGPYFSRLQQSATIPKQREDEIPVNGYLHLEVARVH